MKTDVKTLDAKKAGEIDLNDGVFGVDVRKDVLHRVITWQLAKRRAPSVHVKGRSDGNRTGAKFGRQKGGGRARHGDRNAPIFVGGGKAHGPVKRDYGFALPKKVRALGLRTALSAKLAEGKLVILDNLDAKDAKTQAVGAQLEKLGISSAVVIDGETVNENFKRAASNLPLIDVLPSVGANVYDILRRDTLVLTKAAVENLEARLS